MAISRSITQKTRSHFRKGKGNQVQMPENKKEVEEVEMPEELDEDEEELDEEDEDDDEDNEDVAE